MAKVLEDMDNESAWRERATWWLDGACFSELVEQLDKMFPDAVNGRPYAISDMSEPYKEFFASAVCRPDSFDMKVTTAHVAEQMKRLLADYFAETAGRIYWRIRPQENWSDAPQIIMYDESGPDVDFYTNRRCFLDRRWKRYAIYMRLLRSAEPSLLQEKTNVAV